MSLSRWNQSGYKTYKLLIVDTAYVSWYVTNLFSELWKEEREIRDSGKWETFSLRLFIGIYREDLDREDGIELSIIECVRDRNRMEERAAKALSAQIVA